MERDFWGRALSSPLQSRQWCRQSARYPLCCKRSRTVLLRLGARDLDSHLSFLDAGRLAGEVAQVVELRATDAATADDRDGGDHRAVRREDALDTDSARDLADRERFADATAAAGDAHTFERLEALLVTFFDADVDANRVTGAEGRNISAEPLFLGFDKWMHMTLGAEVDSPTEGKGVDTQINWPQAFMPVGAVWWLELRVAH